MRNTKTMMFATVGVASIAAVFAWAAHGRMVEAKGNVSPFVYEMDVTYFANGARTRSEKVVRAVRQDGSFALLTQMEAPDGSRFERHEIMDLKGLRRSISYSNVNVITTAPVSRNTAARLRADRGKRCGLGKEAKSSRIHGYEVVQSGLSTDPPIADEALVVERWLAPALGCEPLLTTWKKNGEVVLSREVKRIEAGDPPESLFQTSPEHAEMSPGRAAGRLAEELGIGASGPLGPVEQMIDEEYLRSRQAAGWE